MRLYLHKHVNNRGLFICTHTHTQRYIIEGLPKWVCSHMCTLKYLTCYITHYILHLLTLAGAEEILPAGPEQAGESGHAGRDLPLQQRTNSGADLQQVVCADVPV